MQIELPASLAKMDEEEVLLDLAVGMYVARHLTLGQGGGVGEDFAGDFQRALGRQQIPAHFDLGDLANDLQVAAELARR